MKRIIWLFLIIVVPIYAKIILDDVMTNEQMERTGVDQLNYSQKMALQEWVNDNFDSKEGRPRQGKEQLYLSLNIDEGAKLELSDGSTYEIAPEDHLYSSYWITPFPIMLGKSDNRKYPVKITNMNTGTSVSGKQISTRQMLEEEAKKHPPPQQRIPQPPKAPKK
ncbi:MAG: hypothetical protein K1000chlam3_00748 [Chlamydiae bacterium]|nr:hypothetical protein [Chlamydiota bacterium]